MLIRFNVKNFLSFAEREDGGSEEFSMIAGKVRNKKEHVYDNEKIKLLKFAAIYGANASGKSNLVKAMDYMRRIVLMLSRLVDTFFSRTSWTMLLYAENHSISVA